MLRPELVLDVRAELGEGPCWLAERGILLWVDIDRGRVHLLDVATRRDRFISIGQPVGAAVPADDGRLVLATRDGFAFLNPVDETYEHIADVERDMTTNQMNDGKCDSSGRFWAGTTAVDGEVSTGALYRLGRSGQVAQMFAGTGVSNGIDWSPDDRLMYYVDSITGRVDVFDFDPSSGAIADRRLFVTTHGCPDGLAVDAEGGVWVAMWGGGVVRNYSPDGTLLRNVEVPASQSTSCCFGGTDLRELYITTATKGLSKKRLAREPLAGGIFRCEPGVQGQPTREYKPQREAAFGDSK